VGGLDKLYFATISKDVAFVQAPKQLFPGPSGTQIGGNVASLGAGKWLVAYTESSTDLVTDYLYIFFDDWKVPEAVRTSGGRLAIVDSSGNLLGEPVDTAALGAPFPVEVNHLVERPGGYGWIYMDGAGKDTVKIVQLKCRHTA